MLPIVCQYANGGDEFFKFSFTLPLTIRLRRLNTEVYKMYNVARDFPFVTWEKLGVRVKASFS